MSYQALIAPIAPRKHPNADRLQLGVVQGHQVVVGPDVTAGTLGVFFPADGQLSHEMCAANNLYNESALRELGALEFSPPPYGFFDIKRRVRSQKFRGEKSDGLWLPLSSLAWTGHTESVLKSGTTFTELAGRAICNKFETEATKQARASNKQRTAAKPEIDVVFPKHRDTEQFRYAAAHIPEGSVIYISEKLHGTSGRFGNVLEVKQPTWWQRALRRKAERHWSHFNGSRNITLEKDTGKGYYGTNDFRYLATLNLELHKGEILYFELVGYVNDSTPIMHTQPVKDKELQKRYGKTMTYTYGCVPGESKLFVYRILRLNEDGVETELSWPQVKGRCDELGLTTVPTDRALIYSEPSTFFTGWIDRVAEGASQLDPAHIREGVVLRIEQPDGRVRFLKHKSFDFGVLEGYIKDADVVDIEEAA